jgi:hypothetical protein
MNRFVGWLVAFPANVLIAAARVYQRTLGPLLGPRCRFQPTCSNYFIGAVRKNGAIVGTLRGLWRVCRCHPFYRGDLYDPP